MYDERGFTLIELLIVVAIIGILSSLALPSYQDRVIRTQVAEALEVAGPVKEAVEEYYKARKSLPKNNAAAGLPGADKFIGNFVNSIAVDDGAVTLVMGSRANRHVQGKALTLRPAYVKGAPVVPIAWVCGNASVPEGMTVDAENRSTLVDRHMPVPCRY